MKRILSLLLCLCMLFATAAFADEAGRIASGIVGVWIENDGYGTLTMRADGSAEMIYYDDTVTECSWDVTDEGAKFLDGQWWNSPAVLLDENTLSVSDGWMIFTREGFLPSTDPALLLNATPVGEEGEVFLGQWVLTALSAEGETMDPALLGVTMTITFHADGTVVTDDGWEPYTTTWFESYGSAVVEGDILILDENDQLTCDTGDGIMIFTRVPVVEDEPIPADDPIPADAPIPADDPDTEPAPVGEEGAAFLGQWTLSSIEMDGMSMSPAMLGMTMTLTLTEDGKATVSDDLSTETTAWYVENGAAIIDGAPLTLTEDGKLVMEEDGAAMIFVQGEAADSSDELSEEDLLMLLLSMMAATEDSTLPEEHQGFVGEWYLCYVATGGLTGDLRSMGVTGTLTLCEDYTGAISGIADEENIWYEDEDGIIRFGENGMPMYLLGDEFSPAGVFLQYGSEMGGYMIFSHNEEAIWDASAYALQPAATAAPATDAPAVSQGAVSGADHLNTRYFCTTYTAGGYTGDASVLGAEYALFFREDGTADFTMAGFAMTNLPYTVTAEGVYAINYYGTMFNCTPTDAGFDMDYYGTMMMHFTPAE